MEEIILIHRRSTQKSKVIQKDIHLNPAEVTAMQMQNSTPALQTSASNSPAIKNELSQDFSSEISRDFASELNEFAIWKTCLRKILFCSESDLSVVLPYIDANDEILRGEQAIGFLLEILCGLHSPIVGETEVFGQFRNFIEVRKQLNDSHFSDSQKWLHFVQAEVKRARAEHLIGLGSHSYGSLLRRHTKEIDSAVLCGSGQLALEILPWLVQKKSIEMICRNPVKLDGVKEKYQNLKVNSYSEAEVCGDALIIAAPLNDEHVFELIQKRQGKLTVIYDLRGEQNSLAEVIQKHFSSIQLVCLQKFFAEIESNKKETKKKVEEIKSHLLEKARSFMERTELRPMGWDDLCA